MNEKIQFKKQRELGSILTDIFAFIRQNWKPLFGLILKNTGPALLVLLVAYIYYMQTTLGSIGNFEFIDSGGFSTNFLLALLILLLSAVAYYALLYGTILHYIKSYIKNDGIVQKEEVIEGTRKNFTSLLGLSILFSLTVGIGFMFCFLPGIYLGVTLACVYSIHIFEERDVMDSFSHSFTLIKDNWWMTFATFIVVFLLYYFILMIFQIPQYIYFFINAFTVSQELSVDPKEMFDWGFVAISSIGVIAQYLLYTIIVICSAFVYFNLNEKKNFTGTIETIDSLGERE